MLIFGNIGLLFTLLPALIIFFVIKKTMQNRGNTSRPAGASRATNLRPIAEYKTLDPEFDEAELASKISNLYVQLQDAWQAKNLETIRPYLTDAFYNMSDRQVQEMKAEGVTNYVDRIAVLGTDIRGFYQTSGMDHIVVELRTRIVDYTLNDATGELVDGDRNMEKFMTYEWDVCRKTGVKTKGAMATVQSISCPQCGAALNINQTAKCPYCDSIVTIDNEDWALCNIKGISQRNGQ